MTKEYRLGVLRTRRQRPADGHQVWDIVVSCQDRVAGCSHFPDALLFNLFQYPAGLSRVVQEHADRPMDELHPTVTGRLDR